MTTAAMLAFITVQLIAVAALVYRLVADLFVLPFPDVPWRLVELIEILAVIGTVSGLALSSVLFWLTVARGNRIMDQLSVASGQIQDRIDDQFEIWALSVSEKSVALLIIKGFSNKEISEIRGTSPATIKSQISSIFRKSGLSTRQQIVTFFVEEIVAQLDLPNVDTGPVPPPRRQQDRFELSEVPDE
ncbi:helix-turn-helix transcriptional regulator [Rhodobacteraceae bacterium ASV31]|nr:helix-turn-helix transcriptional regulator [Anianabacter salinae]